MKKVLVVLVLVLGLTAGMCSGEQIAAWDLDKMVCPELAKRFLALPKLNISAETLSDTRKNFARTADSRPQDKAVEVSDEMVTSDLRVMVYKPKSKQALKGQEKFPGVLWIHGGGHIIGVPEQDEELCIRLVKEAKCIVVAPDYRTAPEDPYPADVEDCYSALEWMTEKLPVHKDKIAVAGQSAGGGLTAAVALMARDKKGPAICFQMPLYPMLDYRNTTPSSYQIVDHRVWCRDFNLTAWKMYLGDNPKEVPAYASPAVAEDVSNLPPAYIMVGELDPFRDEAVTYAQRLMQAGVPVELHVVPGVFHAFEGFFPDSKIGKAVIDEYVKALVNALK